MYEYIPRTSAGVFQLARRSSSLAIVARSRCGAWDSTSFVCYALLVVAINIVRLQKVH